MMRGPAEATEGAAARGPLDNVTPVGPAANSHVPAASRRCFSDTLLVVQSWLGVSDTASPPEESKGEMGAFLGEARAAGPAVQFLTKSARFFAAGDQSGGSYWAEAASQLAWEVIHTGNWKDVPLVWRDTYSLAQLMGAVGPLAATEEGADAPALPHPGGPSPAIAAALRSLDLAVLLGGNRFRPHIDKLIDLLSAEVGSSTRGEGSGAAADNENRTEDGKAMDVLITRSEQDELERGWDEEGEGGEPSTAKRPWLGPRLPLPSGAALSALPAGSLSGPAKAVARLENPSLEEFLQSCMLSASPAVITGAVDHWPALTRWADPRYLRVAAGLRTVPVEVGQHYLAEGWGQQLMTLGDFIDGYLMPKVVADGSAAGAAPSDTAAAEGSGPNAATGAATSGPARARGYLAQHALFDQIPALRRDITVPDYCVLGEDGSPHTINAWLGPIPTVTPLHYDPDHNLLTQVVGAKYVRLYSPECTKVLAPHKEGLCTNSSSIDLDAFASAADLEGRFPGAGRLPYWDCLLSPGQMLYIPPKWWHYVRSVGIPGHSYSFSVSFWWK